MSRGFRRLLGLAALLSLAGLAACEPAGPAPASARLALEPDGAVHILEPAACAQVTTSGATVSVKMVFQVQAVYPALTKGVAFFVDGGAEPYAVVQSVGPVALSGLAPGRHRLAACLVTKQGAGWQPVAACTCDAVTVDVALTGCSLTVADPMTGDPECNPAAPASTCCVDQNPCSVEACDTTSGTPTCTFQSVSPDCCLSDTDCPADQFCHTADDPASADDDTLAVHRCAPCAACPAAGATCPAVCGACPMCEAEGVCGGGVCASLDPPADPPPEPAPDPTFEPDAPEASGATEGSDLAASEAEPATEAIESGAEAPGYTIEVSASADDTGPAPVGGGSCAATEPRPRLGAFWPMALLALALGAGRAGVRAWGSRSGSSRSSRRRP